MTAQFTPLYAPGGDAPAAYTCSLNELGSECGKVTRTLRGMQIHHKIKHASKVENKDQMQLFQEAE